MTDSWNSLEGVTIAEKFELQNLLSEEANSARFLTRVTGQPQRWGWLRLALWSGDAADDQFELSHPNLLRVWEAGYTHRGDTRLAYLFTEPADEDLGAVLRERPLNQLEAREAVLSAAKALSYLHARKLVHGKLEPAAIVAVGDRIKLSSDAIRHCGESATAAADLRDLGACVYAMFTQEGRLDLERLMAVPQPFRRIVRGCCGEDPKETWTAQKVMDALEWITTAAKPSPPVESPAPTPESEPVPAIPSPGYSNRRFLWLFELACVVAAVVIMLLARKPQPAPSPPHPAQPVRNATISAQATVVSKPAPPPARETAQPRIWRVISYTYSKAEDALRMVGEINRRFPNLHAERFFPNESSPPYFVALGGRMTRNEAMRLRQRAISSGLPQDTFARNFKK